MPDISSSVTIAASRSVVWESIADIRSHVTWMADAAGIRITSEQDSGVGTTFDCETRIGPLHTVDRMIVTDWEEGRVMGVVHHGLVTGTGRFTLEDHPQGGTIFSWQEDLKFPWWIGGRLASVLARPLLAFVWRRNLLRLAESFNEDGAN